MIRPLAVVLLLCTGVLASACGSDGAQRSHVPNRPEVHRPAGLVPDGVVEMRDTFATRRAQNREAMDATLIQSNELQTDEPSFLDGILGGVLNGVLSLLP